MKVLLITGQLARELVAKHAEKSHVEFEVLSLPMPVAALLTPPYIARSLKEHKFESFDIILVPGLVGGDVSNIEQSTGIPTFKGPRYAADLPTIFDALGEMSLSKTVPACDIFKHKLQDKLLHELRQVEERRDELLKKPGNMLVAGLPIGRDFPTRVMAEIVDAPLLTDEEIMRNALYFADSGADIIDIGMIVGKSSPSNAERAVRAVHRVVDLPVSIDTLDPCEAKAAISAGATMVLSADRSNIGEISRFACDCAVVIIPTDHNAAVFPKVAEDRVNLLEENICLAKQLGLKKPIGDLILDPIGIPGVTESIMAFHLFAKRNPNIPLFFGASNVTELVDADSVGVNALLAGLSSELGISIILATEASNKARGSTKELSKAVRMMFLAKVRGSAPKDLGLDLLLLKEKRAREEMYYEDLERIHAIDANGGRTYVKDPKGFFKIMVDRKVGKIVAAYHDAPGKEAKLVIRGEEGSSIYRKIFEMNLVSVFQHAAYLGTELAKAEIALKLRRSYMQDAPLFE